MVTKMMKFTFLAYHKDYDNFLHNLRDLGLIHVAEKDKSIKESDHLEVLIADLKRLNETRKTLLKYVDKNSDISSNVGEISKGKQVPYILERIENEKSLLMQQLQVSTKEREALKPWGNFEPEELDSLRSAGYNINFFVVNDNQYNSEWEDLYSAIIIKKETSRTYFITVTKNNKVAEDLKLEPEKLPDVSLNSLDAIIESIREKIKDKNSELYKLAEELPSLKVAIKEIEADITYSKVALSSTRMADNKLILLQGWAPADNVSEISDYLDSKAVYFEMSDPLPEDDVPIKFKNNRFFRIFEPIAELYMLPKYNEIDLTPYFAPFYMVFFGLSLGDIGYGLFLMLVASIFKILKKGKLNSSLVAILSLIQVLGASTMVCGLITGGFFGFNIYDLDLQIARDLKDKVFFDNNQMFILSLILGVIQIMFGMCMKVSNRIKQLGFVHALSTIGWVVFLLSIIVSTLFKDFMPMFGILHLVFVIPSVILIFFFNSPGKNPFLNLGLGLWDTYNMATGLLGDVLSYVRLFALGLSGGILASVFNSLATGMSPKSAIAGPIVTILIFLIGHAINIFMNVLGAFVHPVRLTFVEFFKNSEFEGGGKKYKPFRREV